MRRVAVLGLVPILACALGAAASGVSVAKQVGCAQRGETSAPTTFNDPRFGARRYRVVIGPVELRGVRWYASRRVFEGLGKRDGYAVAKVALIVRARRSLALTVRGAGPKPALLAYGEDGKPTATLLVKSCPASTPASSRPGVVGSGTLFPGDFRVPVAECVRLTIVNRATGRVWRTRLPFGHRCS
jgi:hypothetical protein